MPSSSNENRSEVKSQSGEESEKPFGAPALMYAFYSFLAAGVLTFLSDPFQDVHPVLSLICLLGAAGLFVESLLLLFFEPTLILEDETVRYHQSKPSIWRSPPRLFRWVGESREEEWSLSDMELLELDHTGVPFPLPVFPFTLSFFTIHRWVLTLKTRDEKYVLLEIGPTPIAFQDILEQVRQNTSLPLSVPWKPDGGGSIGKEEQNGENWFSSEHSTLTQETIVNALEQTDLPIQEKENDMYEVVTRNHESWLDRTIGFAGAAMLISLAALLVFSGLQSDPGTPGGLLSGLFWMTAGAGVGVFGGMLVAGSINAFPTKLRFSREGIQVVRTLRKTVEIPYREVLALRLLETVSGSATHFGLGKDVPCLEVYSEQNWFVVSIDHETTVNSFRQFVQNLKNLSSLA